jgi:beta-N-acetylhexosaminidase
VDSHLDLPIDQRPIELLEQSDLIPFRSAVDLEVEMIMTAHVVFPALDPKFPATLSEPIVQGLLRRKMAYQGVVITDDLDMGAMTQNYSSDECALNAFSAGVDLLLICHAPEKAFSARSAIKKAMEDRTIPRTRVAESLARIRALKSLYAASLIPCDETVVAEYFTQKKNAGPV